MTARPTWRSKPYGTVRPYGQSKLDVPDQPDPPPATPIPETPRPVVGRRIWAALIAGLAVLLLTAFLAYQAGAGSTPQAQPSTKPSPSPSPTPPTVAQIYAAVTPSMVSIIAELPDGSAAGGTGVVVNADGSILTAAHVVNGSTAVHVVFADGTASTATVASADAATDIATLKPDTLPSVVVPAVLGSAGRLAVGDTVVAVGDQLGLTRTTTTGVVSGLDREAPGQGGVTIKGLIQFDAAVNHGSSGGPLLNSRGEVVGIVVALANPTTAGTFIGIGFAVPIADAVSAGRGGNEPPQ